MANAKWYELAKREVGVKEIPGARHNPRVVKYYKDAGHPWVQDDETAWCAAFANAMLVRAGFKGTGKLTARSFLQWGHKLRRGKEGCIVVFKRGNSSWQGHVAFYVGETKTHIKVLGGNQANAVNIKYYPKSRLLGYRWPYKSIVKSKTAASAAGLGSVGLASVADNVFLGEQIASSVSNFLPDSVDMNFLLVGLGVAVVGLTGFIIWDRYRRGKEFGF